MSQYEPAPAHRLITGYIFPSVCSGMARHGPACGRGPEPSEEHWGLDLDEPSGIHEVEEAD